MSDQGSRGRPWRDDRVWQAGFLVGSALGAAATVLGRRAERVARQGLVDWPAAERVADRPPPLRAGRADRRPSSAASEPAYAAAMERIVPRLVGVPRDRAARRRRALGRGRSGRLGPRQRRRRSRSSSASSRASSSTRSCRSGGGLAKATMALANRWVTTRQLGFLLGFMGSKVLGQYDLALLSAEATPGQAPVRRGEHPPDRARASACRSSRSGPGSPCTRRPTRSSSRRIPGSGRTSPSGSSASSEAVRQGGERSRAGGAAQPGPGDPRARAPASSTGWKR